MNKCGCETIEQAELFPWFVAMLVAAAVMLLLEIWKG